MPIMPFGERFICRTPMWRSFARSIVGWSLSGETLSGAVLEVGGGSGAMAKGMLSRFPDVQLTVADLDPLMVESVNRQLASFGDRAKAVVGDATDLPFEDNSFEVVVSNLMLHHIGNWEAAVHEAIRVVRPGGRFVGSVTTCATLPCRAGSTTSTRSTICAASWSRRSPLSSAPPASPTTRCARGGSD